MFKISDVYNIDGNEYMIVDVPTRKNQVNYKMLASNGQIYKLHKIVLEIQGEFVRTDTNWMDSHISGKSYSKDNEANDSLKSGDEVIVNTPSNKTIHGKTAYVVKVNAKTVQIVIPHIGTWNVSPQLIAKG